MTNSAFRNIELDLTPTSVPWLPKISVPKSVADVFAKHLVRESPVLTSPIVLADYLAPDDHPYQAMINEARLPKHPFGRFPSLLLWGLSKVEAGGQVLPATTTILERLNTMTTNNGTGILVGPSGCGKTRSVYEIMALQAGLYFVFGDKDKNDFGKNDGAQDTLSAVKAIPNLVRDGSLQNEETIALFKILVLCRYFVRLWLVHYRPRLTPYEWLLVQLFPVTFFAKDLFKTIFDKFDEVGKRVGYQNVAKCLEDVLEQCLDGKLIQKLITVADEAQILVKTLPKEARTPSSSGHTVVSAFTHGSKVCGSFPGPTILCGTGLSLAETENSLISNSFEKYSARFVFREFLPLSEDATRSYVKRLFPLNERDLGDSIVKWLTGRPRIPTRFMLTVVESKKTMREDFESFLQSQLSFARKDAERTAGQMVYECLHKAKDASNNSQVDKAKELEKDIYRLLFSRWFFNTAYTGILTDESLQLIENNIAFLEKDGPANDHKMRVNICEPLIVEAGAQQLLANDKAMRSWIEESVSEAELSLRFQAVLAYHIRSVTVANGEVVVNQKVVGSLKKRNNSSSSSASEIAAIDLEGVWRIGTKSAFGAFGQGYDAIPHVPVDVWMKAWVTEKGDCLLPAVYFPDDYFGMDSITALLCHDSDGVCRVSFFGLQDKLRNNPTFADAAASANPDMVYANKKSKCADRAEADRNTAKERQELRKRCLAVLDQVPVFRVVAAYPMSWANVGDPKLVSRGQWQDLQFALTGDHLFNGENPILPKLVGTAWKQQKDAYGSCS